MGKARLGVEEESKNENAGAIAIESVAGSDAFGGAFPGEVIIAPELDVGIPQIKMK